MKKNYEIKDVIEMLKPYKTNEERESYLFTEEQGSEILAQCPETADILRENGWGIDFDSRDNTIYVFRMDKYVVIAKCADGDVVVSRDGEIVFDFHDADEIAKDHLIMGVEVEIMLYDDYKEMTL